MPTCVRALRRDDAHRHGLADAERIADREHDVAEPQLRRVAERERRSAWHVTLELQHREIGVRVLADHLRVDLGAVGERDLDLVGAVDDVRVGQDAAASPTITPEPSELLHLLARRRRIAARKSAGRIGSSMSGLRFCHRLGGRTR